MIVFPWPGPRAWRAPAPRASERAVAIRSGEAFLPSSADRDSPIRPREETVLSGDASLPPQNAGAPGSALMDAPVRRRGLDSRSSGYARSSSLALAEGTDESAIP